MGEADEEKEDVGTAMWIEEGRLRPKHRILLEQVRVAFRGWRETEGEREAAAEQGMMEVWRGRCEGNLQELREAGGEELGEIWEGLEEIKKEQAGYGGRVE